MNQLELNTDFIDAVTSGDLDLVKYLIDKGADINTNDNQALRWTSRCGHLELVKYLVSKGANIHAIDNLDIKWASQEGHLDVVRYLKNIIKLNKL
jgi:ankyrin repeat protein